jgi:hypothetical protein
MQLMVLTQMTFGLYIVFLNFFVNGTAVPAVMHEKPNPKHYIGYFAALSTGVAALVSFVSPVLIGSCGKPFMLRIGSVAFMCVALPFILQRDVRDFTVSQLVAIYCIAGIGRASYELANRSIFVDFFSENIAAAMPNIMLHTSIATFTGFFVFPSIGQEWQAGTVFCTSFLGMVTFNIAMVVHQQEQREKQELEQETNFMGSGGTSSGGVGSGGVGCGGMREFERNDGDQTKIDSGSGGGGGGGGGDFAKSLDNAQDMPPPRPLIKNRTWTLTAGAGPFSGYEILAIYPAFVHRAHLLFYVRTSCFVHTSCY